MMEEQEHERVSPLEDTMTTDYSVEVTPEQGGMYRVTIVNPNTNRMVTRRRDVAKDRIAEITAVLLTGLPELDGPAEQSTEPETVATPKSLTDPLTETSDTGHVDVKCTNPECYGCQFCAGGLWACSVCGGFEGSMPSTCPGERMDGDTVDAVYSGKRDFRDGAWVEYTVSRFAPFSVQREAGQL